MIKTRKRLQYAMAILLAIGLSSCGEQNQNAERQSAEAQEEVKPPSQIISLEKAQELYGNYSTQRAPLIRHYEDSLRLSMDQKEARKFDVARYGYYDYKTIKQYLAYIEQEAERVGEDISTLRIYFGTYSKNAENVHPRQNTFMIMPTIKKNGRDYGFRISGDTPPRALLIGDSLSDQGAVQKASMVPMLMLPQGGGSLILNEGQMVPPPYNND